MVLNGFLLRPWVKPLVLCSAALPALWLLYAAFNDLLGANPVESLIRGLGDWALRLLCFTLAITPVRRTWGLTALARWRRGLGLWTFAYALLHGVAYAWFDQGWVWSDIGADIAKRPFITVGVLAGLLMLLLALTSFNRAIRWLGAVRWQRLHRVVYAVAVLAVLHFYWMRVAKHNLAEVVVYAAILGGLLIWRWVLRARASAPAAAGRQSTPARE